MINFTNVDFKYPEQDDFLFNNLSISIPHGITSLVGQNGTGKTSFLLLCAGLIIPQKGEIIILNTNTREIKSSEQRQKISSFIYQNMEFETTDNVGALLQIVYSNGYHINKNEELINTLIDEFELSAILNRKTQEISKGELQRVIIAFSLLYGSKILFMDEPIFAMEEYQKKKTMNFLQKYSKENDVSIVYSAHELDITKNYSENVCFFFKDKLPQIGKTNEIFTEHKLEEVFNVPYTMLKQKEYLFRESLLQDSFY